METENDGFQRESPFSRGWFVGSMLNFSGVSVNQRLNQLMFWMDEKYIFAVVPLGNVSQQKSSNQKKESKNCPTYPWNIHQTPNQRFMKEFLSFGGLGIPGACSKGMLGFS